MYLTEDKPITELVQVWSDSFTIAWTVEIDTDWFMLQHRPAGTETWINSTQISGNQYLYVFLGLQNETTYEYHVAMQRTEDGSVAYSDVGSVTTCALGFGSPDECSVGKNCDCYRSFIEFTKKDG